VSKMHALGKKQLVDALIYRAAVPLRPPFNDLPSAIQQHIVRDVAMPLKIFVPDDESENGGQLITTNTNTDISFYVGSAVLWNKKIVRTLSLTKSVNDPFNSRNLGFPVIWFADNAISCNVISRAEFTNVQVPLQFVEREIGGQMRRTMNISNCEGTFTVKVSNGISLTFIIKLNPTQAMSNDETHVTAVTFSVHLIHIQVTAIPSIPSDQL
jgi:hypothetical protein